MKKIALLLGVLFAIVAAVLSLMVVLTATSKTYPIGFDFGMTVMAPGMTVGDALGLHYSDEPWLWGLLVVMLNASLCFALGALAGSVVYRFAKSISRTHETSG